MKEIIQKENKILREKAKPVPISEITNPKIQKILADMKESLESEEDGVAIAAPQIGISLRIFVVSHRAFEMIETKEESSEKSVPSQKNESTKKPSMDNSSSPAIEKDIVFINPEIVKLSKKKEFLEEGCLSVRWLYGDVSRSRNATVIAYNEKGEKFTRGAGGLLAQIFQHEVDHLDGILFTDKAEDVQEVLPQKQSKSEHEEK